MIGQLPILVIRSAFKAKPPTPTPPPPDDPDTPDETPASGPEA